MKKLLLLWIIASFSFADFNEPPMEIIEDAGVAEVLEMLGDDPLPHKPDTTLQGVSADKGRDLVVKGGQSGPGGIVSRHFVCTSCHNVERDEPTLTFDNPQLRLEYVAEKGLPFLPGSSLYGVVNRTDFYNDDYEKKYGELVKPARNNLREAIQLCAVECSQGRPLDDVEMESILAYLWTIGLKMKDLDLTRPQMEQVCGALDGSGDADAAIELIKSRYATAAPATFVKPPDDRQAGNEVAEKDPANGKRIYELSCLHCHENKRFAFFELDESAFSHRYLEKHIPRYTRYSIYQVIRWGTSPIPGKRAYMPNYTEEKLTRQMVEDLRAYIELSANGKEPVFDNS
jgi:mono/diheme cytochrome c family protein